MLRSIAALGVALSSPLVAQAQAWEPDLRGVYDVIDGRRTGYFSIYAAYYDMRDQTIISLARSNFGCKHSKKPEWTINLILEKQHPAILNTDGQFTITGPNDKLLYKFVYRTNGQKITIYSVDTSVILSKIISSEKKNADLRFEFGTFAVLLNNQALLPAIKEAARYCDKGIKPDRVSAPA